MLIKTWSQDSKALVHLLPVHLQTRAGSQCLNIDFSMKKQRFLASDRTRCCPLPFSFIRTSETAAVTGHVLWKGNLFETHLGTAERVMGVGAGMCFVPLPGKWSPSFSSTLHPTDRLPSRLFALLAASTGCRGTTGS